MFYIYNNTPTEKVLQTQVSVIYLRSYIHFSKLFFLCGPFLVFTEFVKTLLLFHVFGFGHEACGVSLGFPGRNQKYTPCSGR